MKTTMTSRLVSLVYNDRAPLSFLWLYSQNISCCSLFHQEALSVIRTSDELPGRPPSSNQKSIQTIDASLSTPFSFALSLVGHTLTQNWGGFVAAWFEVSEREAGRHVSDFSLLDPDHFKLRHDRCRLVNYSGGLLLRPSHERAQASRL
jgi:hypothetical protein